MLLFKNTHCSVQLLVVIDQKSWINQFLVYIWVTKDLFLCHHSNEKAFLASKLGENLNWSTMVKNKFGVHRKWPRIQIEVALMHKKRDSQSSKNASVVKTHTTHVKISHEARVLWSVTTTKNSVEYVIKCPCKLLRFHSNDRFVKHFFV